MLYYKVVKTGRQGFRSAIVLRRPWRLDYAVGEWTKPQVPDTKLFVFESLNAARDFAARESNAAVFCCEVEGEPTHPSRMAWLGDLCSFWQAYLQKVPYAGGTPPRGTVWVDAVKLIEEVK